MYLSSGQNTERNSPWWIGWYLAWAEEQCPMLLLWGVWSNLASAAWPLSCCCQGLLAPGSLWWWWWPHLAPASLLTLLLPSLLSAGGACDVEARSPPQLTLLHGPAVPHWVSALCLGPPCCRDVTPGHTRVTTLRDRHRGDTGVQSQSPGCLASTLFFLRLHFYLLNLINYPVRPSGSRNRKKLLFNIDNEVFSTHC